VTEHDRSPATLSEQSVPELMRQLSDQTATLVRQELELAKVELTEKGKRVGIGAGMFGAAGVVGLYALGALTAAIILALGLAMSGWLAAVIVAVVYAAIAGALALTGKSNVQRGVPPVPEQTVATVKEDVDVARQRAKEGRQ
jgi:uncharacterized membrane protein YqjE